MRMRMKYYYCILKVVKVIMKVMKIKVLKNIIIFKMCLDFWLVIEFGVCYLFLNKEFF